MATKFKIYLKTNNSVKDCFCDFTSQKQSFCFSYEEQLTIDKNSQKTLTFKMSKYIETENDLIINPYTAILTNGVELFIEMPNYYEKDGIFYGDKYNFIITKIEYSILKNNIIYSFTCQDKFTYTNAKLNKGYYIENDISSNSFIGSQSLDYWANKIKQECHIVYNYKLYDKSLSQKNNENKDVTVISAQDATVLDTITFDCSNSSALNALISLGEQLGLNLEVDDKYNYFYYVPSKNMNFNGLYYSPLVDLKSLNVSQDSSSLTTILNINGPTINKSEITLIPNITPFWINVFNSKFWNEITYYKGIYNDIVNNYTITLNKQKITQKNLFIDNYFTIWPTINLDRNSFIQYNDVIYTKDQIIIKYKTVEDEDFVNWNVLGTLKAPSSDLLYFQISINVNGTIVILNNSIANNLLNENSFISLIFKNNNISADDYNFATMAELTPWLENKIIDLKYFYPNNLTNEAYQNFEDLIYQDLRKINGQLIYNSYNYTNGLIQSTEINTNLDVKLDTIGANIQSDVVNQLKDGNGIITANIINQYKKIIVPYSNVFNYDNMLLETYNNFTNTKNIFCENIYKFKEYWNTKNYKINEEYVTNGAYYIAKATDKLDENVKLILLQLNTYWNQAYIASKFIDYFIPEDWTIKFNNEDMFDNNAVLNVNYFPNITYNSLSSFIYDKLYYAINLNWADISETGYTFICKNDTIIFYADESGIRNQISQSVYIWEDNEWKSLTMNVSGLYVIVKDNDKNLKNSLIKIEFEYSNYFYLFEIEKGISKTLFTSYYNLLFIKSITSLETKTYYRIQIINTGKTWYSLFSSALTTSCPYLNGWYLMKLDILNNYYTAYISTKYSDKIKEHDNKWNEIYSKFGNFLLEDSYTNITATNSKELYNAASLYLKDKTIPERNFNLSIVDIAQLNGYRANLLHIGDQIAINANEFYDGDDSLKKILQQKLFIDKINYTLRDENATTINVNLINYQDKLIKQLVSLIK